MIASSSDPVASTSRDTQAMEADRLIAPKRRRSAVEQNSSSEDSDSDDGNEGPCIFDDKNTYSSVQGLKDSLHGTIYQLKLLMLFVNCGLEMNYDFRLATEMSAADKFDDVVFRYKSKKKGRQKKTKKKKQTGEDRGTVCRYLQAKHRLDKSIKISTGDLLNEKYGDFSVQKYFKSHRKIKKYCEQSGITLATCTMCTNIDFKFSDDRFKILDEERNIGGKELELSEIGLAKIEKPDVFWGKLNPSKQTPRYRLFAHPQSELHEILRNVSDAHVLAKTLAEHVFKKKRIELRSIFKYYHVALSIDVLDVENRYFHKKFINDDATLSDESKTFRRNFGEEFKKLTNPTSEEDMWDSVGKYKMDFSKTFGKRFVPKPPTLTELTEFSKAFVSLIADANSDISIVIVRKSNEECFGDNLDKLAGNVLISRDHEIRFDPRFFDDSVELPGNLKEFKNLLKSLLQEDGFRDLEKYNFEVKGSEHWNKLYSSKKLPDDYVKDEEIVEFFDKFVFAVNQPNEVELDDIIRTKIGQASNFNLLEAELVSNSFHKRMLDWFKKKGERKGSEGEVFTAKQGKAFFKSMEDQIYTLICSGMSSAYSEELKQYKVEFEDENPELRTFLDRDSVGNAVKQILNLSADGETFPTAIRVCNAIQRRQKYNKDHSLIFMRLDTLLARKNKKLAMTSFRSPTNYNLFVIDCDNNKGLPEFYEILCDMIEMENFAGKKLIVITQKSVEFSNINNRQFGVMTLWEEDQVKFNNLARSSKQKVLNNPIINFQQEKPLISFRTLLGEQIYTDIVARKLTDLDDAIGKGILVKLIRCDPDRDKINIGNALMGLGEVEDFYQKRSFNPVFLKGNVLQDQTPTEVFAISGTNKENLRILLRTPEDRTMIQNFNEIDSTHQCKYVILDDEQEQEQWRKLCEVYGKEKKLNIHWLKIDSQQFIWKQSWGDIGTVKGYRNVNVSDCATNNLNDLTENKLADDHEGRRTFIISDTAGMGKSTVLTSLAKLMRTQATEKKSELWVVRINLNDFTKRLEEQEKRDSRSYGGDDVGPAVKFVVEELSNLKTDLEKKILRIMIEKRGGVAMLFDGFDEICLSYENIVIVLLQALNRCHLKKLIISTRPYVSNLLQDKLGAFYHTIVPFTKKDRIRFLKMFWMKNLNQNHVKQLTERHAKKLAEQPSGQSVKQLAEQLAKQRAKRSVERLHEHFAERLAKQPSQQPAEHRGQQLAKQSEEQSGEQVIEQIAESYDKFLGKQTSELFAKLYPGQVSDQLAGQKVEQFAERCDEQERERFTDRLIGDHARRLTEKTTRQLTDQFTIQLVEQPAEQLAKQIAEELTEQRIETYAKVVVDEVAKLIDDQAHGLTGIALQMRMIAEIFQSGRRHRNSGSKGAETGFETCEEFLDSTNDKPARMPRSMNIDDLYRHLVNKWFDDYYEAKLDIDFTKQNMDIILEPSRKIFIGEHQDLALHALFNAEDVRTLKGTEITEHSKQTICLYKSGSKARNEPVGFVVGTIDGKPQFIHRSYAEYFAAHFLYENTLMDYNGDNQERIELIAKILLDPYYGVIRVFLNQLLLKHFSAYPAGQSTNTPLANESLKLSLAAGRLHRYVTVLNMAVWQRHTGVMKYFLNRFRRGDLTLVSLIWPDLREVTDDQFPEFLVSFTAAWLGYTEGLKLLAEYDEHFAHQASKRSGDTLLHEAARYGHLDTVKWLVENGFSPHAPLNSDLHSDNSNVPHPVIELVKRTFVAMVGRRGDDFGAKPLHLAASYGHLDVVKYLLEIPGAQPDVACANGATSLHAAAAAGHLKIVQCLIENGADFRIKCDYEGLTGRSTPLDVAAYHSKLRVVEWFLEEGPFRDGALQSEETDTLRAAAAASGSTEVLKYLRNEGSCDVRNDSEDSFPNSVVEMLQSEELASEFSAYSMRKSMGIALPALTKPKIVTGQIVDVKILEHAVNSPYRQLNGIKRLKGYYKGTGVSSIKNGDEIQYTALINEAFHDIKWEVYEDDVHRYSGNTCMVKWLAAAALGFREILKKLLDEQAPDVGNDGLQMLLHWSCLHNDNLDIVKFLVKRVADIDARDKYVDTPLHLCCRHHYFTVESGYLLHTGINFSPEVNRGSKIDMAEWLVEHGADIEARDSYGNTPLHMSCMSSNLYMVEWLVKRGADVTALNALKQTILHVALRFSSNFRFIGYLVESAKCDVSVVDSNGKTAQQIHIERDERHCIPHSRFHCYICLLIQQYAKLPDSSTRTAVLREECR